MRMILRNSEMSIISAVSSSTLMAGPESGFRRINDTKPGSIRWQSLFHHDPRDGLLNHRQHIWLNPGTDRRSKISPRSQRAVTTQKEPEASLSSPAFPFLRPGHFPANIVTICRCPDMPSAARCCAAFRSRRERRSLRTSSLPLAATMLAGETHMRLGHFEGLVLAAPASPRSRRTAKIQRWP